MNYALLSRILSPWLHSVLCTVQLWPINILNWYHDQDQNLQPKTFAFLTCLRDINWSHVIHVTFLYTVELFVAIANAFTTKIRLSLSCHPFLYISSYVSYLCRQFRLHLYEYFRLLSEYRSFSVWVSDKDENYSIAPRNCSFFEDPFLPRKML